MIIDAHAHAAGDYCSVESIKNIAEKYSLEKICLCPSPKNNQTLQAPPNLPFKQSPDSIYMMNRMNRLAYNHFLKDNGDGNKYIFELKTKLPDLIVQFLWVNPLDAKHIADLENNIQKYNPKGLKIHQAWNPFTIDGNEFKLLTEISTAHKLPIFIHLYSKREVMKLPRFIKNNPNTIIIIGHLTGVELFRDSGVDLKNIYFDTSSSKRIQSNDIKNAIDAFGYENIVFGTDTPYANIAEQINKLDSLSLSDNVKDHIYRLNAKRLLSVDI